MLASNRPSRQMFAQSRERSSFKNASLARAAAFLAIIVLLAGSSYFISSAADSNKGARSQKPASALDTMPVGESGKVAKVNSVEAWNSSGFPSLTPTLSTVLPLLQAQTEPIATYAPDCTTPKTDFNLGDTVCAKATGVPTSVFPWKVLWVDPAGFVRQSNIASENPETTYIYMLPSTRTSQVDGNTVDNVGNWRVNLTRSNGSVRASAIFTVHDVAQPTADVFVQKVARSESSVPAGGSIAFLIVVGNNGPDTAVTVHLVDTPANGSTLASFSQQSGPACVPNGTGDCAIATLANGERAEFTAIYDTGASAPGTYTTSTRVTSTTPDSDSNNNNSFAEYEVTASGGGSQCTLICPTSPAPVNNEPGQNGATVDWDGPNNDNVPHTAGDCGSVSVSQPSPKFFSIGITPIFVTTESGEECSFTVTVIDNENPNIGDCPANMTVPEDSGTPGSAVVEYNPPSATDNSQEVTVTCDPPPGSSFTVSGSPHTVTCTATDNSGNTDSCTFTVTVTSNTGNCTLTPPADITATSDANACGTNVTYTAPTQNGTDCGTVTCDRASGSFFPVGTTVVTCNDTSGASTNFRVTVNDQTAPVPNVNPLPTAQGQCTVTVSAPTATDNCGGQISGTTTDPTTYQTPGTYTVHWIYTDASGNTTNQNQTVIVDPDTSPPVITACAANRTITADSSCAVMPDMTGEVVANDNCTTVDVTQSPAAGTPLGSGNTTVTFTVTDNAGNSATCTATVTVVDNTPPTVTAPADSSASADANCQAPVPDYAASSTASDNCDNSPTKTQSPAAGTLVGQGSHTVTVTATDDAGNSSSDTVVFTVNDTTAPVITCPADITITAVPGSCSTNVNPGTATATDNCSSTTVTASRSDSQPLTAPYPNGELIITWTATDSSGNSSSCDQKVTVLDTEEPTITCPANITTSTDPGQCSANVNPGTPSATDNCGNPTVTGTRSDGQALNAPYPKGTTTITWTATDGSGNHSSCTQTVTVNDTEKPAISCPANITRSNDPGSCSANINPGAPTATDNCDNPTIAGTRSDGQALNAPYPKGTTTITWTATDASGNSSSCTQTIVVNDTEPPTISCPANIAVYLPPNTTDTSMVVNYQTPVGSDNCPAATTTQTAGLPSGAAFPMGTTTNTFRVTDASGNFTECSFTVTVLYNFTGFFSPVGNPPILNSVNAGRSIPVKFSLSGNKGLNIFAPDNPYSVSFNCDTNDPGVDVTETNSGASGLSYNPDTYHYNWSTQSSWVGTCRQLVITLNDGSVHVANFKFK